MLGRNRDAIGTVSGRYWDGIGMVLGRYLDGIGTVLGRSWANACNKKYYEILAPLDFLISASEKNKKYE